MPEQMLDDPHGFLRSRRSIRRFRPDPVPVEMVRRILETSIYAPSAHNLQPCRFVVLTAAEKKLHLAEAITRKFREDMLVDGTPESEIQARVERTFRRAQEAPVIVVLCRDTTQVNHQPESARQQAEMLMGVQSVALAGLQLLLAAHAEGLGATWICWPLFAAEETCVALGLSAEWDPQGMIFLGYPAEQPDAPKRKPVEEISLWF